MGFKAKLRRTKRTLLQSSSASTPWRWEAQVWWPIKPAEQRTHILRHCLAGKGQPESEPCRRVLVDKGPENEGVANRVADEKNNDEGNDEDSRQPCRGHSCTACRPAVKTGRGIKKKLNKHQKEIK